MRWRHFVCLECGRAFRAGLIDIPRKVACPKCGAAIWAYAATPPPEVVYLAGATA